MMNKKKYSCPTSVIDVRLRPDSPVVLSVDYLQSFTIVQQFSWTELFSYWTTTKYPKLNFTDALQFPAFPTFQNLNPSLRHWTILPNDPGTWYLLSVRERLVSDKRHKYLDWWYGGFQKATYRLADFLPDSSDEVWTFVDALQHSEERLFQTCSEKNIPTQQMMNSENSRRIYKPLRFLILSMSTEKAPDEDFSLFATIRAAYSKRFNYTFKYNFVQPKLRPVEYRKIDIIEYYYSKYSKTNEFDYLLWMDWDTCIMNGTISLDSFVPVSLPDIIMTDHDQPINNGVFFLRLRSVPRVGRFIQFWQKQSQLANWLWGDNGSMYPSLMVFLDRLPDYNDECGNGHTLRCFIEQLLSLKYKLPYGRRFSQHFYCIPAPLGFNNHYFTLAKSFGWDPTTTYYPNHGMFMIHDKDEEKWANLSETVNMWSRENISTLPWVNFSANA